MDIRNIFLRNLKPRDFVFYGEPAYHAFADYLKAIEKIKKLSSKEKNILSVYRFGEITCPGISDIDLIFVLGDTTKMPKFLKHILKDKDLSYVVFHPAFIINKEIMQGINYIYPNSNFKLIYGEEIKIRELSSGEHKKSMIFLTADVILRHYPSDYLTILLSNRVNLRMCLLRLNALNHSIKLFKELNGDVKKEWSMYSREISELRENWFKIGSKKRRERIIELLKKAVYLSYDFALEFEKRFYMKSNKINFESVDDAVFKGTKERLSFVERVDVNKAVDMIITHFKKYGNFYSILPLTFLTQLCAYASFNGPWSSYISRKLSFKCRLQDTDEILKKRAIILNEQVRIAITLKHTHFPSFFPLGYKNTSGFENKLRYLALIILNNSIFRKILYFLRSKTKLV